MTRFRVLEKVLVRKGLTVAATVRVECQATRTEAAFTARNYRYDTFDWCTRVRSGAHT